MIEKAPWVPAAALAALVTIPIPAVALERTVTLDPETTEVNFHLAATGHDVDGLFHLREGLIRFDTETGSASGEVTIAVASGESGNRKRDKTMYGKVLEGNEFPLIVFRPERVEGELAAAGRSKIQIHGKMTLVGVEHPVTLVADVEVEGEHLHADTRLTVPFVAWGLHDPSIFLLKVAKEVEVGIAADGTLEGEAGDLAMGQTH
jgi:polyisoprenoid-binding protein YceI